MMFDVLSVIVGITALYGAVLSTLLFIRDVRSGRRTIRIFCEEVSLPVPKTSLLASNETEYPALAIRAINVGYRPVVLVSMGLLAADNKGRESIVTYDENAELPRKLEDGESISIYIAMGKLKARTLRQEKSVFRETEAGGLEFVSTYRVFFTKAFAKDAEGRRYFGKLPESLVETGIAGKLE